jgi:hypothetical protein
MPAANCAGGGQRYPSQRAAEAHDL